MSVNAIYRWHEGELVLLEYCDMSDVSIDAADSWFVTAGTALALGLHRARFLGSIPGHVREATAADAFWDAAVAVIPRDGDWFPRVELQTRSGAPLLVFRLRAAPERERSVILASVDGDPRRLPTIKGPDLERMLAARTGVQSRGAGEGVILTDADDLAGYVAEGTTTCLLWWRGDILCSPPADFPRIDSVTARSVLTLATALGLDSFEEAVTPAELEGTELWAVNALHGIRIVTSWVDGPKLSERPGRLTAWRARLDALRRPL